MSSITAIEILACHGFTGAGTDFQLLREGLSAQLSAPDLPGHGDRSGDIILAQRSMEDWAESILEESADFDVLLGYSMGARLALHLAISNQPKALVLISGSPGIEDAKERETRRQADAALADRIEGVGLEAFLDEWSKHPLIQTQLRSSDRMLSLRDQGRKKHTAAGLSAALRGGGTGCMTPLWSHLPSIRCPVLLVVGAEDEKYRRLAEAMREQLPDAQISVVEATGHAPHFERPDQVAVVIETFLTGALR